MHAVRSSAILTAKQAADKAAALAELSEIKAAGERAHADMATALERLSEFIRSRRWVALGVRTVEDFLREYFPNLPDYSLPVPQRRALVQAAYGERGETKGVSQHKIAAALGISAGTVNRDLAFNTERSENESPQVTEPGTERPVTAVTSGGVLKEPAATIRAPETEPVSVPSPVPAGSSTVSGGLTPDHLYDAMDEALTMAVSLRDLYREETMELAEENADLRKALDYARKELAAAEEEIARLRSDNPPECQHQNTRVIEEGSRAGTEICQDCGRGWPLKEMARSAWR